MNKSEIGKDAVNSPSHYNQGRIEVIEFLEDQNLNFHKANAVKYICRAGRKDPSKEIEDLRKSIWYLERNIEILKPESEQRRPNDMNEKDSKPNTSTHFTIVSSIGDISNLKGVYEQDYLVILNMQDILRRFNGKRVEVTIKEIL